MSRPWFLFFNGYGMPKQTVASLNGIKLVNLKDQEP